MQNIGRVAIGPPHNFNCLIYYFIFLAVSALFLVGCRSSLPQRPAKGFDIPGIKQVLILPFNNMTQLFGENVSVRSPISGKVFVTGSVANGTDELLTNLLVGEVSRIESYSLIPPEQASGIIFSPDELPLREQGERYTVTQIGKRLDADVVLIGHVFRFKERVGGKYAADSPASVAFDINMINTRNGELMWAGHFDETQQSLNENLFLIGTFLKRGGAWVTGKEMAAAGLNELVEKMPKPKLEP